MSKVKVTKAELVANTNNNAVVKVEKDIAYAPLMQKAKRWGGETKVEVAGEGWTIVDSYEFISKTNYAFRAFKLQKIDKKGTLFQNKASLVVMVASPKGATRFMSEFMGDACSFMPDGTNPNTLTAKDLIGLEVDVVGETRTKENGDEYYALELDVATVEECW